MNALVQIETLTAVQVYTEGSAEGIISKLEAEIRAMPPGDMTIKDDREAIRSLAAKIARTKTGLDELGKEFTADIDKQRGVVLAGRKLIRDRLDVLRDEVRRPLTLFEEREAERVGNHEAALVWIAEACDFYTIAPTSTDIALRISALDNEVDRDWQEFSERAGEAFQAASVRLNAMHSTALQAEADAAELAELRRLKAERETADAHRAIADAKAANEARGAEHARLAEVERIERARLAEIERAAQAAIDAEDARLAEIARTEKAERDRVAAAEQAEQDAIRRANAAVEAAAKAKLERNRKHRAKIHQEIVDALKAQGLSQPHAQMVVDDVAAGKIPHVSITY